VTFAAMMFERCSFYRSSYGENTVAVENEDRGREFIAAEKMENL